MGVGSWEKKKRVKENRKEKQKPMDCDPWDSCFCMMRVRKADPPSAVGGLEGIVDGLGYLLLLAHEYTAGVSWIAAVEGEQ